MLVSQLAPVAGNYPNVQAFVAEVLDDQFSDVRAMLQLPRPNIGITPACNFAIVSSLCNLISGISTTIYQPAHLLSQGKAKCTPGEAFKGLVQCFFPYTPPGSSDFPKDLYELCRNPMAHSLSLKDSKSGAPPVVFFTRILHSAHPNSGWTDQELEDLESGRNQLSFAGIVIESDRWTLHCDSFYFDVIDLLRKLNSDPVQMQGAETRFCNGVYNWRR